MADQLRRVKIAPKGMALNDFVAMQEVFFTAEGLDVEFGARSASVGDARPRS